MPNKKLYRNEFISTCKTETKSCKGKRRYVVLSTYLSVMRMNLATKASSWNITFCLELASWSRRLKITLEEAVTKKIYSQCYLSQMNSVLVKCSPFDDFSSQGVVNTGHKVKCQSLRMNKLPIQKRYEHSSWFAYLENGGSRYAMGEEIVKLCAHFEYPRRSMLGYNIVGNLCY